VIGLSILGFGGIFLCLLRRYKKAKKDHLPQLMQFKNLFSTDNLGPRDQEMQRRGGLEEDSGYKEGIDMVPDDMRQGPVVRAQVHMSAAA
jgi:hypothetical protein